MVDMEDRTRVTCNIGNPLAGPDVSLHVITTFIPRAGLVGNENPLTLRFNVTSVNAENPDNVGDNVVEGMVTVSAVADVTLDRG